MSPKLAVIGMGYWGKNLVRNYHALNVLRTVCDANAARQADVRAAYPGVHFCTGVEEVLRDRDTDAVVIATPAVTHYEIARRALEAGKDVFVEKPLALNTQDGADLVTHAARHSRILMVGHVLQYHPAIAALKQTITDGRLGRLQYVYSHRLNIGKIRTEENILWSFAPHDISIILSLIREDPSQIDCQAAYYLNAAVADVTTTELSFPSGVHAHVFVSWLHPFKEQRLVVVGSEAMALFDDTASNKLLIYPHRIAWSNGTPTAIKSDAITIPTGCAEPLAVECAHFVECITTRARPLTDGFEGLRVLQVLQQCENALRTSHPSQVRAGSERIPDARSSYYTHPTAVVDEPCHIGHGTKVWHYSHIMKGAAIGERCVIGQNCNIAEDVRIGDNVKIQNNVSVYTGTVIENDVFLGPSCVLTNVSNPRSEINRHRLYEPTVIRRGASVGANATVVCGVDIGRYSFIGAGAVVTRNVPDYALMLGNPAHWAGWMSRHGHRLDPADGVMTCPESGLRYGEVEPGVLRCLDLDEDAPMPEHLMTGTHSYRALHPKALKACVPG